MNYLHLVIVLFFSNLIFGQTKLYYPCLTEADSVNQSLPIESDSVVFYSLNVKDSVVELYTLESCVMENDSLIVLTSIVLQYNNFVVLDNLIYEVLLSSNVTQESADTVLTQADLMIVDNIYKPNEILIYNKLTKSLAYLEYPSLEECIWDWYGVR
jgi:hypothetical protein